MTTDYGLGAVAGIIPTVLTAGVAMNLIDRVGLGAQQSQQMTKTDTCRKCGNSIPADARFCGVCGVNLRTGKMPLEPRPTRVVKPGVPGWKSPKQNKPDWKWAQSSLQGGNAPDLRQAIFGSFK